MEREAKKEKEIVLFGALCKRKLVSALQTAASSMTKSVAATESAQRDLSDLRYLFRSLSELRSAFCNAKTHFGSEKECI